MLRKVGKVIAYLFIIYFAAMIVYVIFDALNRERPTIQTEESGRDEGSLIEYEEPRAKISLDWSVSIRRGITSQLILRGIIRNDNDFPVGDILVTCTTYGQTNTALSRVSYTFRNIIPARGDVALTDVNFGNVDSQSSRVMCRIVDALQQE